MMCVAALSFAQKAPIDFETGGNGGSNFTWEVSDNGSNPALGVVSNPNKTAPNTSDMVAKFTALKDGQNWALCFTDSIGSFTFTADNSIVKIMVHKTVMSDVAVKFEVPGGINKEIKVKNTKVNEWEELEFDFSSSIGNTYSRLVIIPDFVEPYVTGKDRTADNVIYFDNITFGNGTALAEPTMAAADPTYKEEDVISMFSGVYTDVTVETWRTTWSEGTLTDVKVDGNDVKKYSDLNFVGIEPGTANLIDASGMEHINLDIWSPNSTEFKIKLVDFGADGAFQGGDDTEHELVFSAPKTEEWVNYHIPLSDFTGMTSREHIAQMIFVSAPTGTSVIYVDNVFFSKEANSSVSKSDFNRLNIYPNPASSTLNLDLEMNSGSVLGYTITDLNGKVLSNGTAAQASVDVSTWVSGVYFVNVETTKGSYAQKILIK